MGINEILLFLTLCVSHPDGLIKEAMENLEISEEKATTLTIMHCGAVLIDSSKLGIQVQMFKKENKLEVF